MCKHCTVLLKKLNKCIKYSGVQIKWTFIEEQEILNSDLSLPETFPFLYDAIVFFTPVILYYALHLLWVAQFFVLGLHN